MTVYGFNLLILKYGLYVRDLCIAKSSSANLLQKTWLVEYTCSTKFQGMRIHRALKVVKANYLDITLKTTSKDSTEQHKNLQKLAQINKLTKKYNKITQNDKNL